MTLTVTPQPDAPEASGDAYTTPQSTSLVVGPPRRTRKRLRPRRRHVDRWDDSDRLPHQRALVLGSSARSPTRPRRGFSGTDSFTYRIDDGTGRTADGVVTITVSSTSHPFEPLLHRLGPVSAVLGHVAERARPGSPVPDYDADGDPGLSIKESNGSEFTLDPRRIKAWTYTTSAPLVLNGPVTLRLWSTIANFDTNREGHPYVYLSTAPSGGLSVPRSRRMTFT